MASNGIVLCDLDSTLAVTTGRAHLAASNMPGYIHSHEDWISYSKACINDEVIIGTQRALQLLAAAGHQIWIISGRNIEAQAETVAWLYQNKIPYHNLRLRSANDIQHNGRYKAAYVKALIDSGYVVQLMFEDHIGVSEMIEALGVPVVTVNPRYLDSVGVNFNFQSGE